MRRSAGARSPAEKSREPSASLPPDSCTRSHFAMSSADELMPPAGFVLSLSNGAIGRTLPSIGACVRGDVAAGRRGRVAHVAAGHADLGEDARWRRSPPTTGR